MGRIEGKGREAWLDSLKGFAILLVILGHVLSGYLDAWTFGYDAVYSFYYVRTWIYYFHMPLFFLISGFTFTLAYWRDGKLVRGRYVRQLLSLFYLYVLYALILWCVKQAVPELVNETYDIKDLQRMLVEPLGNFWYLYVLIWMYLLGALTRTPSWPSYWLLLPGALAVMAADLHLDWTMLTLYRVIYHFAFFALGCALCRNRKYLSEPHLMGAAVMFLAPVLLLFIWGVRNWFANWHFLIGLAISMILVQLFYRWSLLGENRFLRLCGRYCLEIYLLHTFFTAGFRNLLPLLGLKMPWPSVWMNFLLSTGLCLGIALLAEKVRALDVLFRPARVLERIKTHLKQKRGL